jgi:GNAT superfamily N-acetyltransferase/DNA-binding MarR family transcriptional regulator
VNFFEQVGKVAIGSRVRFLSDKITEDAAKIYGLYGLEINPKWFPILYVLFKDQKKTITELAEIIGRSHVAVSKIVSELLKSGLIVEKACSSDRRRNVIALSKNGIKAMRKIENQCHDVNAVVEDILKNTKHNLWKSLEEWERLLNEESLYERVLIQKKVREASALKIVPYASKYRASFRKLNLDWIQAHFKVEQADRDALKNPEEYILKKGGSIFVALLGKQVVGVCALLRREHLKYPFELAKMAVAPAARGRGIGQLLGKAIIEKAIELKAGRIYLESNTKLKPAIGLYKKLGFKEVAGEKTPYERCDIQMELMLK